MGTEITCRESYWYALQGDLTPDSWKGSIPGVVWWARVKYLLVPSLVKGVREYRMLDRYDQGR